MVVLQLKLKPNNRLFIIVCQTLAHNQLRADCFVPMLKHAWQTGGFSVTEPVEHFLTVTQINFSKLTGKKCKAENCSTFSFIRCAHCSILLCYSHFVYKFHCQSPIYIPDRRKPCH